MRGMILAAGRGARMGALTEKTPKPLLRVSGKYLIEYAIQSFIAADIREIVINISFEAEQIKNTLGDGSRYGAAFHYSEEIEALETGGGIFKALPLLGDQPFVVASSDIVTDYPFKNLRAHPEKLAHLVLVDNPVFHPRGDFCLKENMIYSADPNQFTFASIGIYRPEFFANCSMGKFPLGNLFARAVKKAEMTGEYYAGRWHNVGTPEELDKVRDDCQGSTQ